MSRMQIICRWYLPVRNHGCGCRKSRGLGYSVIPMLVYLTGACGLRVLWIFTVLEAQLVCLVLVLPDRLDCDIYCTPDLYFGDMEKEKRSLGYGESTKVILLKNMRSWKGE